MSGIDHEQELLAALENIGRTNKAISAQDEPPTAEVETVSKDPAETTTGVAAVPSQVTLKNFWGHPDAHPIVLDSLVLKAYGAEWLTWEPETLLLRIPETFSVPALSDLNLSKLQACRVLHLVDTFWEQWEIFLACLAPFNNEFPDFDVMRVPTVAQCLVAMDTAARIREEPYSEEVQGFVRAVYQHDGIFLPLAPAAVHPEVPEVLVPDIPKIVSAWPAVRASGKPPTGDNLVDEQLRRLSTAWEYLEENRTQLQRQLALHHV